MKIVNIEMINDDPVVEYRDCCYFPVMVTYKPWFSKKLKYKRYNPTKEMEEYEWRKRAIIYIDNKGCDSYLNREFQVFMLQIQSKIKSLDGPVGLPYTEGNRFFGCTADIERKGWKTKPY